MQERDAKLYKNIAKILRNQREAKNLKFTIFCYENDIPVSTYNDIIKSKGNASFYKVAQIVKALDLSFEDFGKLLDKKLPKDFWHEE